MKQQTLILALITGFVAPLGADRPQDRDPSRIACAATAGDPIAICFPERPLVVDHCTGSLVPDFDVDIWHPPETATVGYRFSYQVIVEGQEGPPESVPPAGTAGFPFTGSPDLSNLRPQFSGRARYALRVTVTAENDRSFTRVSPTLVVEDKPRIRGMVLGVSAYVDREYDLNYPAIDARAFHTALVKLLQPDVDIQLDLRTTDDSGGDLSKDGILRAINTVVAEPPPGASPAERDTWNASRLCGENDWYVFYYSGHGIVGVDGNGRVGRYVSTPAFQPALLTRTAIRVTDLATAIFGTSAKNILIVLDSCFSGSHRHATPARPAAARGRPVGEPQPSRAAHSSKVKFVSDGKVQDFPIAGEGDAHVFIDAVRAYDRNHGRGVVLAAASADREAEEGPVKYALRNGLLSLEFERASVAANRTKPGHGLFTFTLLANLLAQLPAGIDVSDILVNGRPATGKHCALKFDAAAINAASDINTLAASMGWELQAPEVMAVTIPPVLPCGAGGE